jgi:hypothetical protein
LRHHPSVYGQSHLHCFQCTLTVCQIESCQLRNQHEKRKDAVNGLTSRWRGKTGKGLSIFIIMTMESFTLFIVRLSHDIACVQKNGLESERVCLDITGASDFKVAQSAGLDNV